jgi:drug/metabolite transporter (DMT)-like permease
MRKFWVYIELFLGMVLFGATLPFAKIVTEAFPVFTANFIRVFSAVIILLPFVIKNKTDLLKVKKTDYLRIFLVSFSGVFLFGIFMMYGMKNASGVIGSIIMSTAPAATALGAFLFLKEGMDWRKITAVGLSVIGIIIINLSGGSMSEHDNILGSVLLILTVFCEASYTLIAKRISTKSKVIAENALLLTFLSAVCSSALFLVPGIFELSSFDPGKIKITEWLSVILWGALGMAIGSYLWFDGIKKADAGVSAGFMGVMTLSGLLCSYFILDEKFLWIHLAGFLIVFSGTILISLSETKKNTKHK